MFALNVCQSRFLLILQLMCKILESNKRKNYPTLQFLQELNPLLKWMKSLLSFQNEATKEYLIVGLGNPGKAYEKTRHNAGFRAVKHFAKRHAIKLKEVKRLSAEMGTGHVDAHAVGVILPLTYMNVSGLSAL